MSTTLFSLEGRSLKLDSADDIEAHVGALKDSPSTITEIRLQGNTLGAPACAHLATYLTKLENLHTANLADIFTGRLLSEIPPALSSLLIALLELPKLETIDLSDNAFGLNTQAPLVEYLQKAVPLRHLILNNNGLGPEAGTLIANSLSKLAEKKDEARKSGNTNVPELETVVCGRNRLENGSMEAWARAYKAHNGVKSIKMTQNGIRQEGISHLLREGLKYTSKLETLDLQDNTFTALGSTALSEVVGQWKSLKELGVGDCLLSARGGIKVAKALAKGENKETEILRLQFNELDAKTIAQFLSATKAALPKLRRIELNGNKFNEDDASIEAFTELLSERKEEHGKDEDDEDYWGVDELDELEEEDSDEEEEDYSADEEEAEEEDVLKKADEAEESNVAQKKEADVDDLADKLSKTEL